MIAVDASLSPDRGELARQMHRRRLRLGLSRHKAAKRAGLAPSTWGQIENGYYSQGGVRNAPKPKPETVRRIAGALEWDLAEALTAAGIDFDPDMLPSPSDEQVIDDATFLELLGGMLPTQRRVLFGLMRTMHDPHTDVDKLLAA